MELRRVFNMLSCGVALAGDLLSAPMRLEAIVQKRAKAEDVSTIHAFGAWASYTAMEGLAGVLVAMDMTPPSIASQPVVVIAACFGSIFTLSAGTLRVMYDEEAFPAFTTARLRAGHPQGPTL